MKVLLVNKFHYLKGGSEKYYFELGKLLKEHGHEVAYFSMKDEKNIQTGDKEYFVDKIDLNKGSKLKAFEVIYSKKNYKKMIEAIEDFNPDIIHLNNFQRQLSASIVQAAYDKKVPMIFTAHDMQMICPNKDMLYKGEICDDCIKYENKKCIKKKCIKDSTLKSVLGVIEDNFYRKNKLYKKIDCILTPSKFMEKLLKNGNKDYNEFVTIHNFVNCTNTNELTDEGYLFFFGRLSKEKGILNLINAVEKVKNSQLYIAGDGPEKDNIIKYVRENHIDNRIKLLGYLSQEKIRNYISRCRAVVVPSVWNENCPYSILETMEIGKPIIGSNIGGIPELVLDQQNGLLYDYNNIDELKQRIEDITNSKDKAIQMGKKSKELFEEDYSSEMYYKKINELYNKVILEKKDV